MNPIQFFEHPAVATPLDWQSFPSIIEAMRTHFDGFQNVLKQAAETLGDERDQTLASVRRSCDTLVRALDLAMTGKVDSARNVFAEVTGEFRHAVAASTERFIAEPESMVHFLFRLRCSDEPLLQRRDLFHIPLSLRHIAGTQRFSIPGTPCLYTSGSTYTCWEEMGRPPFHKLYGAAIWTAPGESHNFLDLRLTASVVRERLEHQAQGQEPLDEHAKLELAKAFFVKFVRIWPLIAACTIRVKRRGGAFVPEYIIPQMVLQWVASEDGVDGVAYQSTHLNRIPSGAAGALANYAFPSKVGANGDLCSKLTKIFRMTDPMPWSLLRTITSGVVKHEVRYELPLCAAIKTMLSNTEFGHVEACLAKIGCRHAYGEGGDEGTIV